MSTFAVSIAVIVEAEDRSEALDQVVEALRHHALERWSEIDVEEVDPEDV